MLPRLRQRWPQKFSVLNGVKTSIIVIFAHCLIIYVQAKLYGSLIEVSNGRLTLEGGIL